MTTTSRESASMQGEFVGMVESSRARKGLQRCRDGRFFTQHRDLDSDLMMIVSDACDYE